MNEAASTLARHLEALGVRPGGVLLVHSSLRSLGAITGGAEAVVQGLLGALGGGGTLLMPALSYATVTPANPVFSVSETPCCVGALPEYFRRRSGTLRSVHPTHSVCGIGPEARPLLEGHNRDLTPCGMNSPFYKLRTCAGQILFLGCGLNPNTSMHAVEELAEPPYLYGKWVDYTIALADGRTTTMRARSHGFDGWRQRYDRIEGLMAGPGIRTGKVLAADCFLLEAPAFWQAALRKLSEAPLYFVDPSP